MDDSGITQVLGLLSEPSLLTTEGEGAGEGMTEGGRPAGSAQAGIPKGNLGSLHSTSLPLLCF